MYLLSFQSSGGDALVVFFGGAMKIARGNTAVTSTFGRSTSWLMRKSTAKLAIS